jgi:hypothetical protein
MCKKSILAGWAKAGLFPFDPDRVLRSLVKPVASPPIRSERARRDLEEATTESAKRSKNSETTISEPATAPEAQTFEGGS